jgi:hypothetical protein
MDEPTLPDATTCRGTSCRQRIRFLPTQTGKTIPVDEQPHPNGNVLIEADLTGEPYAQILPRHQADRAFRKGTLLYMPHHATCPDVEEFR